MQRYAFKMYLNPGQQAEYRRRHDAIWPELVQLLRDADVTNYSIFLDTETSALFACLERPDNHRMHQLADHPVMRKWWEHMRDIMRTSDDGEPLAIALPEMFHMS